MIKALHAVVERLAAHFGDRIRLSHEKQWLLKDIVAELRLTFPDSEFH